MADVLIVDEDPRIRTMLGWYLAVQGHEVRGAGSAAGSGAARRRAVAARAGGPGAAREHTAAARMAARQESDAREPKDRDERKGHASDSNSTTGRQTDTMAHR